MGGAKSITNLMVDLLNLTSKFCLSSYGRRIVSFIGTLIGKRGPDYHGVHIAYSDPTILTKGNNGDSLGPCWE